VNTPPPEPRKWARVRQEGAHGLRRGAWYAVVNDGKGSFVVLDVYRRNVPVDRAVLEVVNDRPMCWSIVRLTPESLAAARARERDNLEPTYAVCPRCRRRAPVKTGTMDMECVHCRQVFLVDWATPA